MLICTAATRLVKIVKDLQEQLDEELKCMETQIISDADGNLHPEKTYSLTEIIRLEIEKLEKLPDRAASDSRRIVLEALGPIRYSYPFLLGQPGPDKEKK